MNTTEYRTVTGSHLPFSAVSPCGRSSSLDNTHSSVIAFSPTRATCVGENSDSGFFMLALTDRAKIQNLNFLALDLFAAIGSSESEFFSNARSMMQVIQNLNYLREKGHGIRTCETLPDSDYGLSDPTMMRGLKM